MRFARRSASWVLLAAFVASCSEGPPRAASLVAHSSVNQTATVASSVTPRPSVQVLDNKGNPFPNFPIEFTVTSGGGTLSRTRDTTDENGIASSGAWQLSTTAGPNTVAASGEGLDGSPLTFTVTGTPTAPTQIVAQGGDNQTATVGSAVSVAPSVVVRDQFANPVPGIPVTFTVSAGGGSTSAATVTSNASGVATLTTWTLGTVAGVNTLSVTADGTAGASITATGQPGPVTAIAIQRQPSGAASGSAIARQPIIRLADAFGNQVTTASSNVTASVASGSGTLSGTTSVASVNGIATFTNLAITGEGNTTLSFSATGGTSAVSSSAFTVSAPAGAASQLVVGTQPSGATSAKVFTVQPDVEVRDAAGINATAGTFSVTATLSSSTGTLTGITTVTSVNGVATFTNLGVIGSGAYTLNFAATSLTGASSSNLSVAAPPIQGIEIFGGDKQAAFAGSAVELKPSVRIVGAGNLPLAGARVTFAVATGGGSITGASAISDASGVATIGDWTLGAAANFNTLTATVEGVGVPLNPVTLSAAGCSAGAAGYRLTLCFSSEMTVNQKAAFTSAAARWESIITNEPEDVLFADAVAAGTCGTSSYRMPSGMIVDDLLIFASVVPIDGAGSILGSAGPCFARQANDVSFAVGDFPVVGQMRFDQADVAKLETDNQLNSVILHEMGHVIGIGVLWDEFGLLKNASSLGVSKDTYFNGANAITGFNEIGFSSFAGNKVPVENSAAAGAGTINSHWRETVLVNELMTGFLNAGNNPLSLLTVRSLVDLGYTVNPAAADPYPGTASLTVAPSRTGGEKVEPLRLGDDSYHGRLFGIDRLGRVRRIR